jgi:hypothetical protein
VLSHPVPLPDYARFVLLNDPLAAYRLFVAPLPLGAQAQRNRSWLYQKVLPVEWKTLSQQLETEALRNGPDSVMAVRILVGVVIEGVQYDVYGVLTAADTLHHIVDLLLALYVQLTGSQRPPTPTYIQRGAALNVKQGQEYQGLLAFRASHLPAAPSPYRKAVAAEVRQGLYRLCQYFPLQLHSYDPPRHGPLLAAFLAHQE